MAQVSRFFALFASLLLVSGIGATLAIASDGGATPESHGTSTATYSPGLTYLNPQPTITYNQTVTFTITNLTGNASAGQNFTLLDPAGAPVDNRTTVAGGNGTYQVTFPNTLFATAAGAGEWRVTSPNFPNLTLWVGTTSRYQVVLTPDNIPSDSSFAQFSIKVTDLFTSTPAAGIPLSFGTPNAPMNARTNAQGEYFYFGSTPPPGQYGIFAYLDEAGDSQWEYSGSGRLHVTRAPTMTLFENGHIINQLSVRHAANGSTPNVTAGSYALTMYIADANGTTPRTADGFGTHSIAISGGVLPGWKVTSYNETTGNATLTGVVPTTVNNNVTFTMTWKNTTTNRSVPVFPGARLAVDPVTLVAGKTTTLNVTLYDAWNNPVPDGKVSFMAGQSGLYPGVGATSANGTGAPGNGQNGRYSIQITLTTSGDLTVYGLIGQLQGGSDYRNSSYASLKVLAAPPQNPVLSIDDASALAGHINYTTLRIRNVNDLGTITATVRYDPAIATLENVTLLVPNATLAWSQNVTAGEATILIALDAIPGASGTVDLARLTLRARAITGATTLALTVREAAHSDGSRFPVATENGVFRAEIKGDVDGDGDVDLKDAQDIANAAIGRAPAGFRFESADINGDGAVTGIDAMMVRQFVAGTRGSL